MGKISATPAYGPEAAGRYLRTLLTQPGPYRARWQAASPEVLGRGGQAAIAKVLAGYMEVRAGRPVATARSLKDVVSRAFSSGGLRAETLGLFARAFTFSEEDTKTAWSLYSRCLTTEIEQGTISELLVPPAEEGTVSFTTTSLRASQIVSGEGAAQTRYIRHRIQGYGSSVLPLYLLDADGAPARCYLTSAVL